MGFRDKIFLFLILILVIAIFVILDLSRLHRDEFLVHNFNENLKENSFVKDITLKERNYVYSKGIYVTFRTAGTKRMDELIDLVKDTELNTMVIDIKDTTGRIGFDTNSELINNTGSEKVYISDIKGLIDRLHQEGIYVIARQAVFQDDFLSQKRTDLALKRVGGGLWYDFKGIHWLDPASREVWDYNLELAKEAVRAGFDEINLDYIRFPSDGDMSQIVYPFWDYEIPKQEIIRQFFEYFTQRVKPMGVFVSADLFGLTLTTTNDMNIGQWLEYAVPYFDYICPMVYPSHYPAGFEGYENPAAHPYEVIYKGLISGEQRIASVSVPAKLRPWLQDFDLGAIYTPEMINLEKKAVYDAGVYGWLLWNPKNIYTEEALIKEE